MAAAERSSTPLLKSHASSAGNQSRRSIFEKLFGPEIPPPPPIRTIYSNKHTENHQYLYPSNTTSTTKYTPWNFVFKNLFEQFRRASNFYFLVVILIQLIPNVSPIFPITSILPLVFVLTITAIREGYEDYKRSLADHEVNYRLCNVVVDGRLITGFYKDVEVGDILFLQRNDEIPADAVLLSSSSLDGTCFIETSNLDGESNLKARNSTKSTSHIQSHLDASQLSVSVECEKPNPHIYQFQATLRNRKSESSTDSSQIDVIGLNSDNLLLRGSSVRNTAYAYALVVYTGPDTKLVMNQQDVPSKFSHVEKQLNMTLVCILVGQVILSLTIALVALGWRLDNIEDALYLEDDIGDIPSEIKQTILDFLTFFVLLNYMIPISLYVTVEMCKVITAYFMACDIDMYHESSDEPAIIKTSNLLDELGQIQYIFSDKTGTLTENVMKFRKCSIGGKKYILPQGKSDGPAPDTELEQISEDTMWVDNDTYFFFWIALAVCHTVGVEDQNGSLSYLASSSDEEALVVAAKEAGFVLKKRTPECLVVETKKGSLTFYIQDICHFDSIRKRMSVLVKNENGHYLVFIKGADSSIMKILSEKSRSTADLARFTQMHLDEFSSEGLRTLGIAYAELDSEYAQQWLQKMAVARSSMNNREEQLQAVYSQLEKDVTLLGCTAIEDRLQDGVPEVIQQMALANIKLWVLTGDKQETAINIGHSCNILKRDGITYLIKGSSAKEVGLRLERLKRFMDESGYTDRDNSQMNKFTWDNFWPRFDLGWEGAGELNTSDLTQTDGPIQSSHALMDSPYNVLEQDARIYQTRSATLGSEEDAQLSKSGPAKHLPTEAVRPSSTHSIWTHLSDKASFALAPVGLVIDGEAITIALQNFKDLFLSVATRCDSVICCRMSPMQKALVVRVVQESPKHPICLAVGDGGNDVSMIQEAKVGVGIIGREGRQAVRASDYAIARFSFLRKLLFVHGRWCYRRMAVLIQYSYYKNMSFILPIIYFAFSSAYTGQTMVDPYVMMCYNIFYTSLPIFLLAIFEQDLKKDELLRRPELYMWVQARSDFCTQTFIGWMLFALWHSIVIYFGSYLGFGLDAFLPDGKGGGLWTFGTVVVSVCVITVTLKIVIITKNWNVFQTAAVAISIMAFYLFLTIQCYLTILEPANMYGVIRIHTSLL
eukprot:TRINITY_DN12068_c0_g1_i3.p1 TRINITY_DN12068_c0_g1~~TRINITY_DN12068_c0_g1_i3.p1  ORF type:complete len:1169 (+),score=197.15 TRINITY_DN12068_c0_g1_i3:63-3569(+)